MVVEVWFAIPWLLCGWAGGRVIKWLFLHDFDSWSDQDRRLTIVFSVGGPITLLASMALAWVSTGRVGWKW